MKQTCLNCKYYRIEDQFSGYCRSAVPGKSVPRAERRMVRQDHACDEWKDCGQNYYIRLGWLKSRQQEKTNPS